MEEKKVLSKPKTQQNLILESREKLSVTGIIEVDSFNDEEIIADTELGLLTVRGENLRINRLNLDHSELVVEGNIGSCEYSGREGQRGKNGGFLAKMFR